MVAVDYLITARLTLTDDAPVGDRLDIPRTIVTRRVQCFRSPCLGTREFPADVMLWEESPLMHQLPELAPVFWTVG
uniref:hypothetical protein n=1 Tax=Azospirillum argentinense TaxID=2970906 RepID=UPI001FFF2225